MKKKAATKSQTPKIKVRDLKPKKNAKAGYNYTMSDVLISSYKSGGPRGDIANKSLGGYK